MTLINGFRYVQATDPGAVGAYLEWLNSSTGGWWVRNAANTGWIKIGTVGASGIGLLTRNGGVMTGALTGAHGCCPVNAPNVHGTLKRDSQDVVLLNDLVDLRKLLFSEMWSLVAKNLLTSGSKIAASPYMNLAFSKYEYTLETSTLLPPIPMPYFPDGTQATEAQVRAYGAFLVGIGEHNTPSASPQDGAALYGLSYRIDEIEPTQKANPFVMGSRVYGVTSMVEQTVSGSTAHSKSNANQGSQVVTWILATR